MSKYLDLSREGLVPKLECPMDKGLLFCNQDEKDQIYIYCISCNYKKMLGIKLYDTMLEIVEGHFYD